jgi:putative flavoprotein involved in K+ transport
MSVEKIDTRVVGGGQAGIAASEHLSNRGVPHFVLERHHIADQIAIQRDYLAQLT